MFYTSCYALVNLLPYFGSWYLVLYLIRGFYCWLGIVGCPWLVVIANVAILLLVIYYCGFNCYIIWCHCYMLLTSHIDSLLFLLLFAFILYVFTYFVYSICFWIQLLSLIIVLYYCLILISHCGYFIIDYWPLLCLIVFLCWYFALCC